MHKPSNNHSVFDEPHMNGDNFVLDRSEAVVSEKQKKRKPLSVEQLVEHTVWDEPGISEELSGKIPDSALTYRRWFKAGIQKTSSARSWLITFLLTLASGPWAVLGVFVLAFQGMSGFGGVAVVIFGPVTEEVLKVISALIVIEKRPFFFKSARQIFICCVFSGLVFAFIENLLYLHLYISNPTPQLVLWRWSVCVLLHSGCTAVSSIGLIAMWSKSVSEFTKPRILDMLPYLVLAAVIHGVYNNIALFISPFFE